MSVTVRSALEHWQHWKLVRGRLKRLWAFLSTEIPSESEVSWTEVLFCACVCVCVAAAEKELAKVKKAYEKDTKIYLALEDEEKNLKHKVQVRLTRVNAQSA